MTFWIYVIGSIDKWVCIANGICFAAGLSASLLGLLSVCPDASDPVRALARTIAKATLCVFIISFLAYAALPSSRTIVSMIVLPKLADSPRVQAIAHRCLSLLDEKLGSIPESALPKLEQR